jgi:hypothetical protein
VVAVGETVVLPFGLTVPTLGEMETVAAPEVVQLKVDCPPAVIVLGLAEKRSTWADVEPTTTCTVCEVVPLAPTAVRV